jgi:predicted nucleotidyltransferase
VAADTRFAGALRALAAALKELGAPSMIIGGVAVIAAGVPRQTIDIDATILGRATELDETIDVLAKYEIVFRVADGLAFARDRQVLLLRHDPTGVTIEVSFAWLPFEENALSRAREIEIHGVTVPVAQPEDLIVYKAAAWRDRDRNDIERLLVIHFDEIDLVRVRAFIGDIAAALDDPDRVDTFDAMVARVRQAR